MKYTLFLFVALFTLACRHTTAPLAKDTREKDVADSLDAAWLEKYHIPFSKDFSDSNQLLFIYTPSFDTSIVLQIKQTPEAIHGMMYISGRSYRNHDQSLAFNDDDYTHFDGFSFRLKPQQWQDMIAHANIVMNAGPREPGSCFDGENYTLRYNGTMVSGGNCGDSTFEVFTQYIKDSLLHKLVAITAGEFHPYAK